MVMCLLYGKLDLKCSLKYIILYLWETIVNGMFVSAHYVNSEVVYKLGFLLTKKDKTKFKLNFKDKKVLVITL